MGREWTERHIRELIKNEIIRIEGQGGSGSGDHPPMDYDIYWPGPIDLVTGGKKAITSIALTTAYPLAWIEFNGYKELADTTTNINMGRWRGFVPYMVGASPFMEMASRRFYGGGSCSKRRPCTFSRYDKFSPRNYVRCENPR